MKYLNIIQDLVNNIDIHNKPKKIDLVLDSGGFKGSYLLGALYYLKYLEKEKYIIIDKISGSSIGAILGTLYILDKLDLFEKYYPVMKEEFKKDLNLKYILSIINDIIDNCNENDYLKLNNRLILNYYNIKVKREYIIKNYKSNLELKEFLIYTSFIPYLTNGKLAYNNNVDGNKPTLLNNGYMNDKNILYISLVSIGKLRDYFNTVYDNNCSKKIINGILDIHDFFLYKKPTKMCSYVNNWTMKDFFCYRIKEFVWILLVYNFIVLEYIYNLTPYLIKDTLLFKNINLFFRKSILDVYIYTIFS